VSDFKNGAQVSSSSCNKKFPFLIYWLADCEYYW